MKTDIKTINYIAALAKLKFEGEEAEKFAKEFDQILEHFENLASVDLTNIDIYQFENKESVLRDDVLLQVENKEELFRNAKDIEEGYILIPKVIE